LRVKATSEIKEGVLKIPFNDNEDIMATSILQDKVASLNGSYDNINKVYIIPIIFINNSNSGPVFRMAPNDDDWRSQIDFVLEKINKMRVANFRGKFPVRRYIDLPYYTQYQTGTCWAAAALILLKGYNNTVPTYCDTIYKICRYMNVAINEGLQRIIIQTNGKYYYENFLSNALSNTIVEKKTWCSRDACLEYILSNVHEDKPVILWIGQHFVVVNGVDEIKNIFSNSIIIVQNPAGLRPLIAIPCDQLIDFYQTLLGAPLVTFAATKKIAQKNLQTLHMQAQDQVGYTSGILFRNNELTVASCYWDNSSETGYKFESDEIPKFNQIRIFSSGYNTYWNDVECLYSIKLNVLNPNGTPGRNLYSENKLINLKGHAVTYTDSGPQVTIPSTIPDINPLLQFGDPSNFIITIDLYSKNGTTRIDGYNVKFKYAPLVIGSAPKVEFAGKDIQLVAMVGDKNVTNITTWKYTTDSAGGVFTPIPAGLFKTSDETIVSQDYYITATYTYGTDLVKTSEPVKIKILPGIIPNKKTLYFGQSSQFKLGNEIKENSSDFEWSTNLGAINPQGLYTAPGTSNMGIITATFKKGATLFPGETLETDIMSEAKTFVYNIAITQSNNIMDFNDTTTFQLINYWNNSVFNMSDIDWYVDSVDSRDMNTTENKIMKYKPTKDTAPGKHTITAKLKKGTFLSPDHQLETDLYVKAVDITVVKISYSPDNLSVRSTPIDAIGNLMEGEHYPNTYGTTADFAVSVDGLDVPINYSIDGGLGKGTLSFRDKVSDTNNLHFIYNFNFKPANSTKIYYDSDDPINIKVTWKNPDNLNYLNPATLVPILIYRPVLGTFESDYHSGTAHGVAQVVKYSSMSPQEFIYHHGYYRVWYIPNQNQICEEANYFCGQGLLNSFSTHYYQDGKLIEMCLFGSTFLEFEFKFYKYEFSGGLPITKISVFKYTRPDFYSPWSSIFLGETPSDGWIAPPKPLQPILPVPDQPIR